MDRRPIRVRLMERIAVEGECWRWTGTINPKGYGSLSVQGRCNLAHRLSYEAFCGPIGEGLQIDHLCRNRACINPAHLEAVTASENCRRAAPFHPLFRGGSARLTAARASTPRTACKRGHPWVDENITINRSDGRKRCKICSQQRERSRIRTRGVAA